MSTIPSTGQLGGTPTNAQFQGYIEDFRDFVVESVLGASARHELTIASGAVTPPDGATAGGGIFKLDTEGNAATDTLDTIAQTNTHDGQILILMAENVGRVVTLNHAAGGAGQMLLSDSTDYVFASLSAWVAFRRDGTDWVELCRSYAGGDYGWHDHLQIASVPAHNILCPHQRLVINYATAATLTITADAVVLADASGRLKRFSSLSETLTLSSTGANGRDVVDNAGAEQANAWYHLFAIGRTDGTLDVFASQVGFPGSGTSIYTRLPSGYTWAGYLGAARNDGSSNLVSFGQRGGRVVISTAAPLVSGTATALTSIDLSSRVPVTAQAIRYDLYILGSTTGDKSCAIYTSTTGYLVGQYLGDSGSGSNVDFRWTDTAPLLVAQTLAYQVNAATTAATMTTLGYEF